MRILSDSYIMRSVISIKGLSKQYRIGSKAAYKTLRESIMSTLAAPARLFGKRNGDGTIWALKDISFDVNEGDVIGIIGRNGAGKSTLLKILSRITEPTDGEVRLRGRVGSLLEVGTGFHPELTGRENIFLNGAILGMRRHEIRKKFDEIVAFAEIEKFLDTPVKRYSSGMFVRLAFAVAAHLEPEILLVDEVLAVGDLAFQKKCMGKMGEVSKKGRTVLFVSHNMQAIRSLCPRAILLDGGRLISDATTEQSLSLYNQCLRDAKVDAATEINNTSNRRGTGVARFTAIAIQDTHGGERFHFSMGDTIKFKLSYKIFKDIPELYVFVALLSGASSEIVTSVRHLISSDELKEGAKGTVVIECPDIYIRPGEYPLYFWLGDRYSRPFDVVDNLTAPLVISINDDRQAVGFNPSQPVGFFSIPSKSLILKE